MHDPKLFLLDLIKQFKLTSPQFSDRFTIKYRHEFSCNKCKNKNSIPDELVLITIDRNSLDKNQAISKEIQAPAEDYRSVVFNCEKCGSDMNYNLIKFYIPQSLVVCLSQSNTGNHFKMPSEIIVRNEKYELFSVVNICGAHATANVRFENK